MKLKVASDEMKKQMDYYNNLDFDNLVPDIEVQLQQCGHEYHEAREKYSTLVSELQTQKLYEGFAESAPQFCLQMAIILVQGNSSKIQLVSTVMSLISLTLCATDIFLSMKTKGIYISFDLILQIKIDSQDYIFPLVIKLKFITIFHD